MFVLQFFRDPPRDVPRQHGIAVSPPTVACCWWQKARDPYLNRDALKISVFMNVFNVHSNRSPVAGAVKQRWYHAGKYFNASLDKSSAENERMALWIQTEDGIDVTCVQIAGLVARRILCYVNAGDRARARTALRLHPLRLARRSVPAGRQHAARQRRRQGHRRRDDRRRAACGATRSPTRETGCVQASYSGIGYRESVASDWPTVVDSRGVRMDRMNYPEQPPDQAQMAAPAAASAATASTGCPTPSPPWRCSPASTPSCRR